MNASPVISGKWIAWLDTLGDSYDQDNAYYIYNLDTGVETKIVSTASAYENFDLAGNYFVWISPDNQVYLRDLSQQTAFSPTAKNTVESNLASLLQSLSQVLKNLEQALK